MSTRQTQEPHHHRHRRLRTWLGWQISKAAAICGTEASKGRRFYLTCLLLWGRRCIVSTTFDNPNCQTQSWLREWTTREELQADILLWPLGSDVWPLRLECDVRFLLPCRRTATGWPPPTLSSFSPQDFAATRKSNVEKLRPDELLCRSQSKFAAISDRGRLCSDLPRWPMDGCRASAHNRNYVEVVSNIDNHLSSLDRARWYYTSDSEAFHSGSQRVFAPWQKKERKKHLGSKS